MKEPQNGDTIEVDIGHGPHEHWVTATVIGMSYPRGLWSDDINPSPYVKLPSGEHIHVVYWRNHQPKPNPTTT